MGIFDKIRIGDWLVRNKPGASQQKDGEYTFVWYTEMETNGKTFFTQPFRTRIKAGNINEAKKELKKIVNSRMNIVIMTEDEYKKSPVSRLKDSINKLYDEIARAFKKF